ncbi:hypothetical protein ACLOJK_028116 [Asimina triloba]
MAHEAETTKRVGQRPWCMCPKIDKVGLIGHLIQTINPVACGTSDHEIGYMSQPHQDACICMPEK